jgi:hypothetical protein
MMTELTDDKINKLWYQSQNDVAGTSSGHTTQQHYFARLLEKALAPSKDADAKDAERYKWLMKNTDYFDGEYLGWYIDDPASITDEIDQAMKESK